MSTDPTDILTVISYNSTGFNNQRADFICDIIDKRNRDNCIVAVQEHFIYEKKINLCRAGIVQCIAVSFNY